MTDAERKERVTGLIIGYCLQGDPLEAAKKACYRIVDQDDEIERLKAAAIHRERVILDYVDSLAKRESEIERLKAESIDHVFCACHRELTYKIELNSICVDRCICQEQEIAQLQAEVAAWIGVCVKNRSK